MKRCSIAEAKAHLPELVTRAERVGRETIIERRGRPVARIVPLSTPIRPGRRKVVRDFDSAIAALDGATWGEGTVLEALEEARGRLE